MSAARIRVLVVEDSLSVRRHIVEVLSGDDGFDVVGEAEDGKAAIELCRSLRPDVITMDMMLPVLTGLSATEWIMAYCPTPILIVSASTNRGEVFRTYDALAAGAVDVLEKPRGDDDGSWEPRLRSILRLVARIRVITHPRARLATLAPSASEVAAAVPCRVVALGASTGGPGALLTVLRELPEGFPIPVLVVLHISEPFGAALAQWLDEQVPLPVRYAADGEPLPDRGVVLLAPPGRHLVVTEGTLRLTTDPERHSCRPSVDVLFESLARYCGAETVACLLTGMGKDGALGLLALRDSGGLTIAQDEATSVVFGMPAEAIRLGAARRVLPLPDIASALTRAMRPRSRGVA